MKLSACEESAMLAGWQESERVARTYGKARYNNPHDWASRLWQAFELGYYLHESGRTLGVGWQRQRGNIYRNNDGYGFKLEYGKNRNSFGIQRNV